MVHPSLIIRNRTKSMTGLLLAGVLMFFHTRLIAAQLPSMTEVLQVVQKLKKNVVYGYSYDVVSTYPNGRQQAFTGTMLMDIAHKSFLDKNKMSITLVNNEWSYKADISLKKVSVVRIARYYQLHKDREAFDKMFSEKNLAIASDSVLLRYGKVLAYSNVNNIVTLKLGFTQGFYISRWDIVYDCAKDMPVSILIEIVTHAPQGDITSKVTCAKFKKQLPPACFSIAPYFEIKSGKLLLKQFKNYQIISEL